MRHRPAVLVALVLSSLVLEAEPIRVNPLPKRETRSATKTNVTTPSAAAIRERVLRNLPARPTRRVAQAKIAARPTAYALSYRANGTPRQLRPKHMPASIQTEGIADPLESAREFLRVNRSLLRIDDPDRELVPAVHAVDDLGGTHIRFRQQWQDVPVWPAELIVHLDEHGQVELVDGAFVPSPRRIARKPTIDASTARLKAGEGANPPELIVLSRNGRRPRLAWKTTVSTSLAEQWIVVIDAQTGAELQRYNNVKTAAATGSGVDLFGVTRTLRLWQQGSTFYLLDTSKQMFDPTSTPPSPQSTRGGIFVSDFAHDDSRFSLVRSNSANNWPIRDSVSAAFFLGQTYDYFLERHGRNSIDGEGGTLAAAVRFHTDYLNAFWVDEQQLMVFGDGLSFAASLDVIAHEMAHGVTSHSANLVYEGQSGAINEAMSDVFGEMAEARFFGTNDWLMGTHIGGDGPIRSMADPNLFNDPAKMSQYINTVEDNGGVHINSGIINRAFYLLAEGMNGAIGRIDAERIFYRALTQHLTRDSQFIDMRLAAITSARELFGETSNQAIKTAQAFDGVEIFLAAETPEEPPIPPVVGLDSTLFLYIDGADSFLGRREGADPEEGVQLSDIPAADTRPAVTGDGLIGAFVSEDHDICLFLTNGSTVDCVGFPEDGFLVSSVGMAPDSSRFGFVLLGEDGEPEPNLFIVGLETDEFRAFDLSIPTNDGEQRSSVAYADAMTFSADGDFLVYDALNVVETSDGEPWSAWSIYALDIDRGFVVDLVPAIQGLDIGYPALGHTSDDLLTFEVYDPVTDEATVFAADLDIGFVAEVGSTQSAVTSPAYTGADLSIVYAVNANNPSGSDLVLQKLAPNQISPSGALTSWIDNAMYGVPYRRGTYSGPTTTPGKIVFASSIFGAKEGSAVTITVLRSGGSKGPLSVTFATSSGTATSGQDFTATSGTLSWADGDAQPKSFLVRISADELREGYENANVKLTGSAVGSLANATINIENVKGRRRGARH